MHNPGNAPPGMHTRNMHNKKQKIAQALELIPDSIFGKQTEWTN